MIIGITTTFVEEKRGATRIPVERVTVEYLRSVCAAGAAPVLLPPVSGGRVENEAAACELIDRMDGLVFAGGGDIGPERFGEKTILPETDYVFESRDYLELKLARLAHERDLPTLGICRGMQVINVALGGTLCQDVRACGLTVVDHQQKPPYDRAVQRVHVMPGSLLGSLLCTSGGEGAATPCEGGRPREGGRPQALDSARRLAQGPAARELGLAAAAPPFERTPEQGLAPAASAWPSLATNSMHHQAVAGLAEDLRICAVSSDGVVEGLEDPSRTYYLGVQWHPEYLDAHAALFQALVKAVQAKQAPGGGRKARLP